MRGRVFLFVVASILFAGVSQADQPWSHTTGFAYAQKTSIKIIEPNGYKVSLTVDGRPKEDTVPAVFNLPDHDAFLPLTITAPDGKHWTGKIEVKAHQQTTVKFTYAAPGAPAPQNAGPARKFMGRVYNVTNYCHPQRRYELRFEFLKGGQKTNEYTVPVGGYQNNLEVEQGTYDVRVFVKSSSGWNYNETFHGLAVEKDNWDFAWGCTERNGTRLGRAQMR
jgi:hypothetical protein